MLKPIEENPKPWVNEKGKAKMIGMVGTNRWSPHGMETGYCMNFDYWGQGYGGEAFRLFLSLYWTLPGMFPFLFLIYSQGRKMKVRLIAKIERKALSYLVAKVDLENTASKRIIQRAGARKGELLKERYGRYIDGEGAKKRDAVCWYLDRPGLEEDNMREWENRDFEEMERREREAGEAYARKVRDEEGSLKKEIGIVKRKRNSPNMRRPRD